MALSVINPANGKTVRTYSELGPKEVRLIIEGSQRAFEAWRKTDFDHRASLMRKAAGVLREKKSEFAERMTVEMGKPISGALAEAEKCAWVCDYYADKAGKFLSNETIETDGTNSFVTFQPIGIVLAVMPWNFPFWQVFRFAAPALMAGNAGLLKHASNVPGCALAIEQVFREAGFPEDIFRTLLIGSSQVSAVIEHDFVKAVTLTGSTPAGRAVAAKAGELLKKTVLELGGSDPYIILEDVAMDDAVKTCVLSRLINSGQSCIAAKRFIVIESRYDEFVTKFVAEMEKTVVGDPMNEETLVGPMARHDLRDELHDQVIRSIQAGARCLTGGTVPDDVGAYYPPTVLADVRPGMAAFDEELFGPVAAIIKAENEEDAIQLANNSVFGLGAAVFTGNRERGTRIAATELEAGCCFVNEFVKSDPRLPFGGIKESGYGRELSYFGIREFVNIKTVYVK